MLPPGTDLSLLPQTLIAPVNGHLNCHHDDELTKLWAEYNTIRNILARELGVPFCKLKQEADRYWYMLHPPKTE